MSNYKHGIATSRQTAEPAAPKKNAESAVFVVGTAPVNLAVSPAVNEPVLATKKSDAVAALDIVKNLTNIRSFTASTVTLTSLEPARLSL